MRRYGYRSLYILADHLNLFYNEHVLLCDSKEIIKGWGVEKDKSREAKSVWLPQSSSSRVSSKKRAQTPQSESSNYCFLVPALQSTWLFLRFLSLLFLFALFCLALYVHSRWPPTPGYECVEGRDSTILSLSHSPP